MSNKLRPRYQIHKEVSRSGYFEGFIEVSALSRLSEFLISDQSVIRIRFEMSRSGFDIPLVKGQMDTTLLIECQRCLGGMEFLIQREFELLVDASDELLQETSLDTVYSVDGQIDIFEIVEDELILGLPLVAMHEDVKCNKHWSDADQEPQLAVKDNPFLVLKKLKTSN